MERVFKRSVDDDSAEPESSRPRDIVIQPESTIQPESGQPLPDVTIQDAVPQQESTPQQPEAETQPPAPQAAPAAIPEATSPQTPEKPVTETRNRTLYLMRIENDGTISRVTVNRALPQSDSPLMDSIKALLQGASQADKKNGLVSLIPENTQLLSAMVRGTTAYLNFNENFQFNQYGAEGYAAQLRQIIWTATEFPTVKDVQFLIEGRRLDFLGAEAIPIGIPLDRNF